MAKLAAIVEKLDAVPEAQRPLYVEQGGKFILDVDPESAETVFAAGLKAKNSELLGQIKKGRPVLDLIGARTIEEIQADLDLAAQTRTDKAKAAGDYESLKTQLVTAHTKEKEALQTKLTAAEAFTHKLLVQDTARQAIVDAGGEPDVLMPHITAEMRVIADDGKEPVARVVKPDGTVRIADTSGTPMTAAQLVELYKANPKFSGAFAASGATGGGARNTTTVTQGGAIVVIPKNADVPTYRRMKADAEKRGVPYQVANR